MGVPPSVAFLAAIHAYPCGGSWRVPHCASPSLDSRTAPDATGFGGVTLVGLLLQSSNPLENTDDSGGMDGATTRVWWTTT